MSYSHTVNGATSDQDRIRHLVLPVGVGTAVATIGFTALGIFGDGTPGAGPHVGEFLFLCAVVAVAAAGVFGLVVPRALTSGRFGGPALAMSLVAALIVVPVFWSGLPPVLGMGGALLGMAGRNAESGQGKSQAAIVLGLLAVLATVAIYVLDWMNTNGIM